MITTRPLEPFGIEVRVPPGSAWADLGADDVHRWVAEHRVVVIRGLLPFEKAALPGAARRLGPLQAWSFGAVNELKPEADTRNYLYTRRAVPLHWDGAFVGRAPRYLFFHCVTAPDPDAGGETIFVDTARVWARADEATRDRWRALRFTYATEQVVHYGGRFSADVVAQHPDTGETVMRFAEPVDDLNPVSVRGEGLSPLDSAAMITELRRALGEPAVTLAHRWESGDVVIADNLALLHGRRPFAREASRHIRRVNVHRPERTWRDAIRDSVRIRRPEFMVAEIPILLVPALLVLGSFSALVTERFAETAALFFLLFHFGDMINCLADRDLDAVYKTHLSEAVYGLGVRNVRWQLALTVVAALGLTAHLAWQTERWDIFGMVVFGILLAAQYSVGPLWLKSRGLWQVAALWAVIFIGPMVIVARILGGALSPELLAVVIAYGAMQEGIVLVNTAEDLPEDDAAGIRTVAVSLGLRRCLLLSIAMVGAGGATLIAAMSWLARGTAAAWSLVALAVVWCWVVRAIALTWKRAGAGPDAALRAIRRSARRMPIWITLTAWTTLLVAAVIGVAR